MHPIKIYEKLLDHFGSQDWWPMKRGFEPKELEVCIGAILTQNTSWKNVEKALLNLKSSNCVTFEDLLNIKPGELENLIRPSGFYKQKAKKLKNFVYFVRKSGGIDKFFKSAEREELLNINGIGFETADSILLYACSQPIFVVDAYTRRAFSRLGFIDENWKYDEIRLFFEKTLPKDLVLYKEFHALIVELGKNYCRKKPLCKECPLCKICKIKNI